MRDLKPILNHIDVEANSLVVNQLRLDSRDVKAGDVFVAIKGHQLDGGPVSYTHLTLPTIYSV